MSLMQSVTIAAAIGFGVVSGQNMNDQELARALDNALKAKQDEQEESR